MLKPCAEHEEYQHGCLKCWAETSFNSGPKSAPPLGPPKIPAGLGWCHKCRKFTTGGWDKCTDLEHEIVSYKGKENDEASKR